MDILDSEASEDEVARKEIPLNRLPSHEANKDLIEKERRYRTILTEAAASDETIRQKWDEWEDSIHQLTWDEVSSLSYRCRLHLTQAPGGFGSFCTLFHRHGFFPPFTPIRSDKESRSFSQGQVRRT